MQPNTNCGRSPILAFMTIQLLSCNAQRPDRRAIQNAMVEYGYDISDSLAMELTDILLEGDAVDIGLVDNSSNSALRVFRKLDVDYEFVD